MTEPMTDERLERIRAHSEDRDGEEVCDYSPEHVTELLAEVDRLRAALARSQVEARQQAERDRRMLDVKTAEIARLEIELARATTARRGPG